jgi:hypothetical protein
VMLTPLDDFLEHSFVHLVLSERPHSSNMTHVWNGNGLSVGLIRNVCQQILDEDGSFSDLSLDCHLLAIGRLETNSLGSGSGHFNDEETRL